MATTMRRRSGRGWLARATVGSAAVVGLAVAVGACGGGGNGVVSVEVNSVDDRTPAEVLAAATDASAAVESGRMRATTDYDISVGGDHAQASMQMSGSFTDQGRRSEITADMGAYIRALGEQMGTGSAMSSDAPESMVMRMVLDSTTMYVKFDVDPPEDGTQYWYATDLASTGMDVSTLENPAGLGGGPTSYIESLRGAGADVAVTGTEEIDGVDVTRIEGTIDPSAAIDRAAPEKRAELRSMLRSSGMTQPMPFVAWVDHDGLLRRVQMTLSADMGLASFTARTTVDYYDFGADVSITAPPADLVRDASELSGGTA